MGGGKTTVIEGNRISSFQLNNSAYGLPVPLVLGTSRIAGNIIDWVDFTTITHTETQRSGKGGGGSKTVTKSYTYTVAAIIGLCEGKINGVGQIWREKDVLNAAQLGVDIFSGAYGQAPWNYMASKHPGRALSYSGLCYVAGTWDLGSSGSLPTLNFEVKGIMLPGDGIDVNPAEAVKYIITDSLNGVGFGLGSLDANTWQQFKDYAAAAGLLVSLPLTERRKAFEVVKDICECANADFFWSQNKLKFVVKADEQIGGYTPIKTPWYELTGDDFLPFGNGSLVKFSRKNSADAFNAVSVEFTNRANGYQKEQATYMVTADIARRGMRQMPKKALPYLHTKARAEYVARTLAQESLFIRVKYTFKLGWTHCLLEPGDFVTLTEKSIGLTQEPVIIEEIIETADGELECIAYGRPDGVYNPPVYDAHQADRPFIDFNAPPGSVEYPVIFEPPPEMLAGSGFELCLAVCGENPLWGGAYVWASYGGDAYQEIGEVTAPARMGKLLADLPEGSAKDYQNSLKISLLRTNAELLSVTTADADSNITLCYVDGEYLSYETAVLEDAGEYTLKGLRRGVYGSDITAHQKGGDFVRIDNSVIHYPYKVADIGRAIYLKFTSYNVFGAALEDLSEVQEYKYIIKGGFPVDRPGFTVIQNGERLIVTLDLYLRDENNNSFYTYELRLGSTWETSVLIDRFMGEKYTFDAPSEGTLTFWLKAIDKRGIYSENPGRALVNVTNLPVRNVISERAEDMSLWQVTDMRLDLKGRYVISSIKTLGGYAYFADIFREPPYLRSGAEILFPIIDLGQNILDESCYWVDRNGHVVLRNYETLGSFAYFSGIFGADLTPMPVKYALQTFLDIDVSYTISGNARVDIEYRVGFDGLNWGEWTPSAIKQFSGRYVQIRLLPTSIDGLGQVFISGAAVAIDVPDIEDIIENIKLPAEKTRIYYRRKFMEIKSIGLFTQDTGGRQATWQLSNVTNEYFDLEILGQDAGLIPGKLQKAVIRGY